MMLPFQVRPCSNSPSLQTEPFLVVGPTVDSTTQRPTLMSILGKSLSGWSMVAWILGLRQKVQWKITVLGVPVIPSKLSVVWFLMIKICLILQREKLRTQMDFYETKTVLGGLIFHANISKRVMFTNHAHGLCTKTVAIQNHGVLVAATMLMVLILIAIFHIRMRKILPMRTPTHWLTFMLKEILQQNFTVELTMGTWSTWLILKMLAKNGTIKDVRADAFNQSKMNIRLRLQKDGIAFMLRLVKKVVLGVLFWVLKIHLVCMLRLNQPCHHQPL